MVLPVIEDLQVVCTLHDGIEEQGDPHTTLNKELIRPALKKYY